MPAALIALTSLVGCSKGLGSADTDNLNVNIETRGVTISMWSPFGQIPSKALEESIDEFQTLTGIKVEYETKGNYQPLNEAIKNATADGSYPNVALGYPDHFAGYINSNIQMRLDGLIKNDSKRKMTKKDAEGFDVADDGIRHLNYNDFYESYRRENETLEFKSNGEGYVLGLPFNKSTEVMECNAHFFDWVKTRDELKDKIYIPETWEQARTVGAEVRTYLTPAFGKVLCSDGVVRDAAPEDPTISVVLDLTGVTADTFRFISYDSTDNFFITLVRQFGGTYTEIDKTKTGVGYAAFNDEKYRATTLEVMDMIRDMADKKILGIPETWDDSKGYCTNAFTSNRVLLNIGSSAGVGRSVANKVSRVTVKPIPQKAGAETNYVISQGTNLCLFNKGSEAEKVAAWKLMVYLSQQANGTFAYKAGYFPTGEIPKNSADYQDYLNNAYGAAEKANQDAAIINSYTYTKSGWDRFTDPGFLGSSAIRAEVDFIIPNIFYSPDLKTNQAILDKAYTVLADYVRK